MDRCPSPPRHPARPEHGVAASAYAISLTLSIRRARLEAALAHVARHVGGAIRVARAGRRLACPRARVARQAVVVARARGACSAAVPVETHGLALTGVRAVRVDLAPAVHVAAEKVVRLLTVGTKDHAPRLLSAVGAHTTRAHAGRSRAGSRTRGARAARATRRPGAAARSTGAAARPSVADAGRGRRPAASAGARADE